MPHFRIYFLVVVATLISTLARELPEASVAEVSNQWEEHSLEQSAAVGTDDSTIAIRSYIGKAGNAMLGGWRRGPCNCARMKLDGSMLAKAEAAWCETFSSLALCCSQADSPSTHHSLQTKAPATF
jgi:hypothetical protein